MKWGIDRIAASSRTPPCLGRWVLNPIVNASTPVRISHPQKHGRGNPLMGVGLNHRTIESVTERKRSYMKKPLFIRRKALLLISICGAAIFGAAWFSAQANNNKNSGNSQKGNNGKGGKDNDNR